MKEMTTEEVQQFSLDILQDFHDFCVRNDIHYSLSGGTLLGAVRHNGFIPWDDDIDVQMPRPDYDRFVHTYKSDKYIICCRELPVFEKKGMAYPYARLCDTKRTNVDTGIRPWISEPVGVWIDIMPCDGMPSDKEEAQTHIQSVLNAVVHVWRSGVKKTSWKTFVKGKNLKEKIKFLAKKIESPLEPSNSYEKMTKLRKKYDYISSEFFFATPHYGLKEWQPKKNMEEFILHKFEDREFYIMSGWDENLKSLYGDYMKLPPIEKRITHDFNRYYWKD